MSHRAAPGTLQRGVERPRFYPNLPRSPWPSIVRIMPEDARELEEAQNLRDAQLAQKAAARPNSDIEWDLHSEIANKVAATSAFAAGFAARMQARTDSDLRVH